MIVRQALFEGSVHPGREADFRAYVDDALLPLWRRFPGVREVRVLHEVERDSGVPEVAMVLSMVFDDPEALQAALELSGPLREPGGYPGPARHVRRSRAPPRLRPLPRRGRRCLTRAAPSW